MTIRFPAPDLPSRMIHGICSSERIVDGSRSCDGSDNAVMLARSAALATPVPLRLEHTGEIGKVVHLRRIGSQLYCRAIVFDRQVWDRIERVELRGLSCGFIRDHYHIQLKEVEGIVKVFDRYRITEISVVRSPLNQDCFFRIYAGGAEAPVAGQLSLSETRKINDRARAQLARLNQKYPAKVVTKTSGGLSAVERRRFDAWYQKSFTEDGRNDAQAKKGNSDEQRHCTASAGGTANRTTRQCKPLN